jgi:peptide-N4-(N-acetyl-beta-glucosaminyl)asparagine amidase
VGGEMGYGGIHHCLSVEFDSYLGWDTCRDPDNNHISIHCNGSLPVTAHHRHSIACTSSLQVKISDGGIHAVKVEYDPHPMSFSGQNPTQISPNFKVYLDQMSDPVLSANIHLKKFLKSDNVWCGFTAATGGLTQEHCILQWRVYSDEENSSSSNK